MLRMYSLLDPFSIRFKASERSEESAIIDRDSPLKWQRHKSLGGIYCRWIMILLLASRPYLGCCARTSCILLTPGEEGGALKAGILIETVTHTEYFARSKVEIDEPNGRNQAFRSRRGESCK